MIRPVMNVAVGTVTSVRVDVTCQLIVKMEGTAERD